MLYLIFLSLTYRFSICTIHVKIFKVSKEEHAEKAEALKPDAPEAPEKEGVNLGLSGRRWSVYLL